MVRKTGIPGQHAHGRQVKPGLYLTQLRESKKFAMLTVCLKNNLHV